ncbi:MAG: hypothetical protein AAF653_16505 [Chloroflexota bacterium]
MNRVQTLLIAALLAVLVFVVPVAAAQGNTPQLAYVNSSGQLVVTSADGATRWVVTNPNEPLVNRANLAWAPNGQQLFFAVNTGSGTSLRMANTSSQSVTEIGTVDSSVNGGEWSPDGRSVVMGSGQGIVSAAGSAAVIIPGGQLTGGQAFSPNGRFLFYHNGGGYSLAGANGANPVTLPGRNDATAAGAGLWADSGAVVAYWTFTDGGTSALNVTNAANGETLMLDSGTSVPVTPLAWLPNSQTLLYRSAQGVVAVDASCVQRGCSEAPAQTAILPVTAANVLVTDNNVLVFTGNGGIFGINASCVSAGNCADGAVSAGGIAGNSRVAAAGNVLPFTCADNALNTQNAG